VISRTSIAGAYPLVPLGEVADFLDHLRRPVKESERQSGPYPYFGANGQQGTIGGYLFDEPLVLLAEDGGFFDQPDRGIAYAVSGKTWVNNHAHVLRPRPHVEPRFLCRVLENYDVTPFVTGTTRGKLTKAGASGIPIPLPPLAEQQRIAEVLDRAEALRNKRRAVLARLAPFTQALFVEAFGDPLTNPRRIDTCSLDSLCIRITDGTHQSPPWSQTGHPFLFVSNIVSGELTFETGKFISDQTHAELMRKCPIEVGDILYSTVGTYGVPALIRTQRKFAFQRHIAHLKPDPAVVDPEFLRVMLASPPLRRQADRAARGAAQKTVNLSELKNFIVFRPPLEAQREFNRRVAAVERLKTAQRASLAQLDALFASLQHRAFRGEL
jgi:type I restriction enzyme S subunit